MRRLWGATILAATATVLLLAGCVGDRSIFQGGTSLTAAIPNPVTRNDMAVIESAIGSARAAAVNYRRLGLCPSGTTLPQSLLAGCALREGVIAMQQADQKVKPPLAAVRSFVRDNDQISALSSIGALRQAVADFQNVELTYGAH